MERSQNRIEWTDGMLYPVLHRMERKGWVKSRWSESDIGRKRKYYSLSKDGRVALEQHRAEWALVDDVFAALGKETHV